MKTNNYINTNNISKKNPYPNNNNLSNRLKLLVFDADDTLWDCQSHFEEVTDRCADLLSPFVSRENVRQQLFETERSNMPLMGFGTKAFTISLLENALKASNYNVPAKVIEEILFMGKQLLRLPATPLEGVEDTLAKLKETQRWNMIMFTKGESLDQKGKIERSGLEEYFDSIVIVDDKTDCEYLNICSKYNTNPEEVLMIGNSLRSDIAPALRIGAYAAHIPFSVTWELEHAEPISHERLFTLKSFTQLTDLLL